MLPAPVKAMIPGRLPGVVQQFHRGDLSFVREEKWTPVKGWRASAAVKGISSRCAVPVGGRVAKP